MDNCCYHSGGFDKGSALLKEKNQENITAFSKNAPQPLKGGLKEPVPSSLAKPITVSLDTFGQHTANVKITKVKTYAFPKSSPKPNPEFNLREPFPSTVSETTTGVVEIPKDVGAELVALAATAKQIAEKANRDVDLDLEDEFNAMYEDLRRLSALAKERPLSPAENTAVSAYRQRINDELNQRAPIPNGAPAAVEPDAPGNDADSVVSRGPAPSSVASSVDSYSGIRSQASSVGSSQASSVGSRSQASSVGSLLSGSYISVDSVSPYGSVLSFSDLSVGARSSASSLQYPYHLFETPARAPSASASSLTVDESKYATPIRANPAPVWEIGDEKSQDGSVRSVDSTKLDNDDQRRIQGHLMNYKINELRAISKAAGIVSQHKGNQKKAQIAARLVNNRENPVVKEAILNSRASSAKKTLDNLEQIFTPLKAMKTRAKTKAFTPGSIERLRIPKQARATSPNNLFK